MKGFPIREAFFLGFLYTLKINLIKEFCIMNSFIFDSFLNLKILHFA
jgi:hypothetical protein